MLETFVNNQDKTCRVILIEDDVGYDAGQQILKAFVAGHATCGIPVCVLCYDVPWDLFIKGFEDKISDRICKLDGFKDPLKWNDPCDTDAIGYDLPSATQYASVMKPNERHTLVINSLMPLLLHGISPGQICRYVHRIIRDKTWNVEKIVMLLPVPLLQDQSALIGLRHMATTLIQVLGRTGNGIEISIKHKCGNKVTQAQECINITANFGLQVTEVLPSGHGSAKTEMVPSKVVDPTKNLTFNLTLRDDERSAREKVTLPYLKQTADGDNKGGVIYYEPEDGLGSDEEDPDDDLDL